MALRACVLLGSLLLLGSAGCLDQLYNQGTVQVNFRYSTTTSVTIRGVTYQNLINNFQTALIPVILVQFHRSDGGNVLPDQPMDRKLNAIDLQGQTVPLTSVKGTAGVIDQVSVSILRFNATLNNGTIVAVHTPEALPAPLAYPLDENGTIPLAGTLQWTDSFIITEGPAYYTQGTPEQYFLMMLSDESGPGK
ncbi:MAG: hypothetical protein ACYDDF_12210 [Thermoplasmatota archaeon]